MNLICLFFGHDPENKEYLYVGGVTKCLRCEIIISGASDDTYRVVIKEEDPIFKINESLSIHGGRLDYLEDKLRMILETIGKDPDE